jgi:hypothetical protein
LSHWCCSNGTRADTVWISLHVGWTTAVILGRLVQISNDDALVVAIQWRVEQIPGHRHRPDVLARDLLNENPDLAAAGRRRARDPGTLNFRDRWSQGMRLRRHRYSPREGERSRACACRGSGGLALSEARRLSLGGCERVARMNWRGLKVLGLQLSELVWPSSGSQQEQGDPIQGRL